jgi:hypothetical protein
MVDQPEVWLSSIVDQFGVCPSSTSPQTSTKGVPVVPTCPVGVTFALAIVLTVPKDEVISKPLTLNLLSVLVVTVPKAEVELSPVSVTLASPSIAGEPTLPVASCPVGVTLALATVIIVPNALVLP